LTFWVVDSVDVDGSLEELCFCSSLCSLLSWHEDEVDEMGDKNSATGTVCRS
jgi:hypothetical protein